MTFDLVKARARLYDPASETTFQEEEEMLAEIERLQAELTTANVELIAAGEVVHAKDARIKELEEVLAEYQRLGKVMNGRLPCLTLHGECDRCSSRAREVCEAMHQIAEGKISVGDHMVEPDQMVALNTDHECPNAFDDWGNPINIRFSGHAGAGGQPRSWQITEEATR